VSCSAGARWRYDAAPMSPPTLIDGARVLEWAWSDVPFGDVRSTDGAVAMEIHGLALCQYEGSSTVVRLSCNSEWGSEQDAEYASVDAAKSQLPAQYRRVPAVWNRVAGAPGKVRLP
jgi:hypothetical protein